MAVSTSVGKTALNELFSSIGCACLEKNVALGYEDSAGVEFGTAGQGLGICLDEHLRALDTKMVTGPTLLAGDKLSRCGILIKVSPRQGIGIHELEATFDVSSEKIIDQPRAMFRRGTLCSKETGLNKSSFVVLAAHGDTLPGVVWEPTYNVGLKGLALVEEGKVSWPLEESTACERLPAELALPAQLFKRGSIQGSLGFNQSCSPFTQTPSSVTGSTPHSTASRHRRSRLGSRPRSGSLEEERTPFLTPCIKWRIRIDRGAAHARIGINIDNIDATKGRDGALQILDVEVDGLVKQWNVMHKNRSVMKGDYIVEVNGEHGSPDVLREVLTRDAFVDMMVLRGT